MKGKDLTHPLIIKQKMVVRLIGKKPNETDTTRAKPTPEHWNMLHSHRQHAKGHSERQPHIHKLAGACSAPAPHRLTKKKPWPLWEERLPCRSEWHALHRTGNSCITWHADDQHWTNATSTLHGENDTSDHVSFCLLICVRPKLRSRRSSSSSLCTSI